jgi:hypothetical protein
MMCPGVFLTVELAAHPAVLASIRTAAPVSAKSLEYIMISRYCASTKELTCGNGKRACFRRCSMMVPKFPCAHAFCAVLNSIAGAMGRSHTRGNQKGNCASPLLDRERAAIQRRQPKRGRCRRLRQALDCLRLSKVHRARVRRAFRSFAIRLVAPDHIRRLRCECAGVLA